MKRFLKFLVSVTLVVFAIYLLDVQTIMATVRSGSPWSFMIAVALNMLAFLIMGMRWHVLIAPVVGRSATAHMAVYLKGTFLNTFTPANLGGDAYRLAVLRKEAGSDGEVVKLLLRERIIGLYGYAIVFVVAYSTILLAMDLNGPLAENPYTYGVLLAAGMALLPFVARRLGSQLAAFVRGVIGKERLPGLEGWAESAANLLSLKGMVPLMSFTFVGIFLWAVSIKVVGEGFGVSIPLTHLAAVATLVEIIRLVPITIQGIGLREGAFAYLLAFLGHSPEQSYVVGTLAYLALSVAIILCGPLGHAIMKCEQAGGRTVRAGERIE